jgi:hypothetical protein
MSELPAPNSRPPLSARLTAVTDALSGASQPWTMRAPPSAHGWPVGSTSWTDDNARVARGAGHRGDQAVRGSPMTITLFFRWYDLWIGAYVDVKNRTVYICPLPMVGIKVVLP